MEVLAGLVLQERAVMKINYVILYVPLVKYLTRRIMVSAFNAIPTVLPRVPRAAMTAAEVLAALAPAVKYVMPMPQASVSHLSHVFQIVSTHNVEMMAAAAAAGLVLRGKCVIGMANAF